MTAIIAYATVVRAPLLLGFALPNEERSVGFSAVVEEDFHDSSGMAHKRALYRVILVGDRAEYALAHLRNGASVLVRGELCSYYPPSENPGWNYRVVFGDELIILSGALNAGRAYAVHIQDTVEPSQAMG